MADFDGSRVCLALVQKPLMAVCLFSVIACRSQLRLLLCRTQCGSGDKLVYGHQLASVIPPPSPEQVRNIAISVPVCLFSARISQKPRLQTAVNFLRLLPVVVSRDSVFL